MPSAMTDEQKERESVEAVFSLGGGELDDKPVTYTYTHEFDGPKEGTFHYTFDGAPEWCDRGEFPDDGPATSDQYEYFTAVRDCLWGLPPESIEIKGKRYTRVGHFVSSGETECTAAQCDEDPFAGEVCPLCEREIGDEHGCIYLGDGWAEVIYRHDRAEHRRGIAKGHNIQVWEAMAFTCETCDVTSPDGAPIEHEQWCEVANVVGGAVAWWWQSCSPGCLPDGDTSGPFDSEFEALEDATDGLED